MLGVALLIIMVVGGVYLLNFPLADDSNRDGI